MPAALAMTALLMGLAAGPHCMGMCGAACAGVSSAGGTSPGRSQWAFQAGRLAGYSLAGAATAQAVESLAWLSTHTAAIRPVWTLFHMAVFAWGLVLLVQARQPAWVDAAGRAAWALWMDLAPRIAQWCGLAA